MKTESSSTFEREKLKKFNPTDCFPHLSSNNEISDVITKLTINESSKIITHPLCLRV